MVREIGCGSIVVGTEATAEGFAIGLASKGPMADAAFGLAAESFCDTPVEAFDEAVGMRPAGPRFGFLKLHVPEAELAAIASGRYRRGDTAFAHIRGKAVSELATIVDEDVS